MTEKEFEDILARYPDSIEEGNTFERRQTTVSDKLYALFAANHIGQQFTSKEIIDLVIAAFPETNPSSVCPPDYCYNITNAGINFEHHLFEYLSRNQYKVLGNNYPYVGPICWKGKKVGEWPPDGTGPILHEKC